MNRSENMRRIRSKNMCPELAVRSLVHKLGYRFNLHGKNLPGKPDLVFVTQRKVIFVHGCFWHSHQGCKSAHIPKSNLDYWGPKLERNRSRDTTNIIALRAEGWKTLVIWECETRGEDALTGAERDALVTELFKHRSKLRWSWSTLSFRRITDETAYAGRLRDFADSAA